jgi:hypothetical protein
MLVNFITVDFLFMCLKRWKHLEKKTGCQKFFAQLLVTVVNLLAVAEACVGCFHTAT